MSKTNISLIMDLLDKHGSFDAIRKTGEYDRTTVWRWEKKLATLGYSKNGVSDFIPIYVKNDFEAYYTECSLNRRKIYHNWGVM